MPKCQIGIPENATDAHTGANCPQRLLLDQISDKWSVLIVSALNERPLRFNEIKNYYTGITQKALTQTLRRMERNGMVDRLVVSTSPVRVEYRITPLGRTLEAPFRALCEWTADHLREVEKARAKYDRQGKSDHKG
jgi:DNA-binding HxlR family transcriptional regulator